MIERPPLLTSDPSVRIDSLEALLGLANAIEHEAVARYGQLAELMEARGEGSTAAAFREMRELELQHVDWVLRLGEKLHQPVPAAGSFTWTLPPELAESWDSVRDSSLLTPYRALAIAVTNEERAFALYSYVAAHAEDAEVAREAEKLAREELSHAAELRVKRRLAFHDSQAEAARRPPLQITTLDDFQALEARLAGEAAVALRAAARRLDQLGDRESARLLGELAEREARRGPPTAALDEKPAAPEGGAAAVLQRALRVLESASEIYEDLAARTEQEALLPPAQASLERMVEGISLLTARLAKTAGRHEEPLH
ncbi:hypothetical protein AAFN88_10700 [Pelagibius sp. CAU 1746]|uniref:hypothetical protein n=1 Tax=Pelagibius sp. CAU 1746 TaxID=3140370 RepID=UPI00325A8887